METTQYYGADKIMGVTKLEEVTPAEQEMVEVLFESGEKIKTSKKRFDLLVTDKPSDASEMQKKIKTNVGALIYSTLHEYDINAAEVNGICDIVVALVENGRDKAFEIMFGHESAYIPLLEINKVLYKNAEKESDDGASSEGSKSDKAD